MEEIKSDEDKVNSDNILGENPMIPQEMLKELSKISNLSAKEQTLLASGFNTSPSTPRSPQRRNSSLPSR